LFQARIQRGAQGARAPPEKSQRTLLVFILGQFFGEIPQIFAARFARRLLLWFLLFFFFFLPKYGKFSRLASGVMRPSRNIFMDPCLSYLGYELR